MKKIVVILSIVFVLCILLLVMPSAAANVTATVSPSTVAQGDTKFSSMVPQKVSHNLLQSG